MSASDPDISDFSSKSPFSQVGSPVSSPSQQVPQLANFMTELSCGDKSIHTDKWPSLHIVEEPQNHFRFRYKSEMIGTHGCLLGKSHQNVKSKTHPSVELRNYSGKARIRCTLARHDSPEEHPHKLQDDQDRDVNCVLPEHGSYKIAFSGMGIIHTAKKDVPALLYKKYAQENKSPFNENKLRVHCESQAKTINLNIVRLRFSAHDLVTNEEICKPVFSQPIHNLKSAATNDLRICRMSRIQGRPRGGDDVFILVEKVKKNNIEINFFELNEYNERTWTAKGSFMQSEVHHQYAIVFRTPPYRDKKISSDVHVFIELVRPSDGRTSEPQTFTYKAEQIDKQNKKRKANSSYSSLDSSSGGSLNSFGGLPVTISYLNQNNNLKCETDEIMAEIPTFTIPIPQVSESSSSNDNMMGDAFIYDMDKNSPVMTQQHTFSPMLSQPNVPAPPILQFNSSEIERLTQLPTNTEESRRLLDIDISEYFNGLSSDPGAMSYIKCSLVGDSGRPKDVKEELSQHQSGPKKDQRKRNNEYSAYYKSEDGVEVKKLVKELCEIIRNKTAYKKQVVRNKLDRLFDYRLSNGDTFLHMTLCSNQPTLDFIVKLIHSMKMSRLLNLRNDQMQTILHLAVINDSPGLVTSLISKGCDPMIEDDEGNNVIHYAVICQSCLSPLLDAMKTYKINYDINAYNSEKQTALHLAAIYESEESVSRLVGAGASVSVRDLSGRTPLHLAALDASLPVARELIAATAPTEIDAVDARGYTALQIICDGEFRPNTLEIMEMLLEKKADPMKSEGNNKPAWKLVRGKHELKEVMQKYTNISGDDDDIKSEPEEEFESADEGEAYDSGGSLEGLSRYVGEVSGLLDRAGSWRVLAARLRRDSLLTWYQATSSPTTTLLTHVKDCGDDFTSESLARLLEEMGELEAAVVIKRYLNII